MTIGRKIPRGAPSETKDLASHCKRIRDCRERARYRKHDWCLNLPHGLWGFLKHESPRRKIVSHAIDPILKNPHAPQRRDDDERNNLYKCPFPR